MYKIAGCIIAVTVLFAACSNLNQQTISQLVSAGSSPLNQKPATDPCPYPGSKKCLVDVLPSAAIGAQFVFLPDSGYMIDIRDSLIITKTDCGYTSALFLRGSKTPETCSRLVLLDSVLSGRNDNLPYNYNLSLKNCTFLVETYYYDFVASWEGPAYWSLKK
jgi:hypothetical protein